MRIKTSLSLSYAVYRCCLISFNKMSSSSCPALRSGIVIAILLPAIIILSYTSPDLIGRHTSHLPPILRARTSERKKNILLPGPAATTIAAGYAFLLAAILCAAL